MQRAEVELGLGLGCVRFGGNWGGDGSQSGQTKETIELYVAELGTSLPKARGTRVTVDRQWHRLNLLTSAS